MHLNMSVFEMIRNRDTVLMKVIEYQLNNSGIKSQNEPIEDYVIDVSKNILN